MKVSRFRLRRAVDLLQAGGVVCHPTEAVWGLACMPNNPAAVARVCAMKQRDPAKGLLLVADSIERVGPLLETLSASQRERVLSTWPGPVTWVIPDTEFAPAWVRGRFNSVAVRVSDHPLTAALCKVANSCLVSTSANPAGLPPARNQEQAQRYFAAAVHYYMPGRSGGRDKPSAIRDALTGELFREG